MRSQYCRQDSIAGNSLVIPIEAGRNHIGREERTMKCLSFSIHWPGRADYEMPVLFDL